MDWNEYPKRSPGMEISEVTDGFIVSHAESERIHYLNATAAFLLEVCDGTVRADELPGLLAMAFSLEHSPDTDFEECLDALSRQGLLVAIDHVGA